MRGAVQGKLFFVKGITFFKKEIKELDGGNKELREQLKFAYAEVYKKFNSTLLSVCSTIGLDC